MKRILISSCLLGYPDRYDGQSKPIADSRIESWWEKKRLIPFCPEVAGGLPVPRPPAEIIGSGGGAAVLDGAASVMTRAGRDVTTAFVEGARSALAYCRRLGIRVALFTDRSPSCGSRFIYNGTFKKEKIPGMGVTSALLTRNGIHVYGPGDLQALIVFLANHV